MTTGVVASLRDAAYALCRAVTRGPSRNDLATLLRDLQVSVYPDGRPGRGIFGYYARKVGFQFGGYLALDANRSKVDATLGALPQLLPSERQMLAAVHAELAALNVACLKSLAAIDPVGATVADPYFELDPQLLSPGAGRLSHGSLLDPADVSKAAMALETGGLISGIKAIPVAIRQAYDQKTLTESVAHLDKMLRRENASKGSEVWTQIAFQTAKDFPPRLGLAYHVGITGLRSALRCLNQMIFQAVQHDRLPTIDHDAIVSLDGMATNVAERVIRITAQPSEKTGAIEPGDIVYVSHQLLESTELGLAELVALRRNFSQEAGTLEHFTLHLIDSDLNPSPLFEVLSG